MKVGVIGGGLSGLSCASRLQELGVAVSLYDTGKRGPGGRASSRLWRNAPVDHAAQFAEARTSTFREFLESLERDGKAKRCPPNAIATLSKPGAVAAPMPEAIPRFIGVGGMGQIADALASSITDLRQDIWVSPNGGIRRHNGDGRWIVKEGKGVESSYDAVVIAHNGKCAERLTSKQPSRAVHMLLRARFAPKLPQKPQPGGGRMTLNSIYSLLFEVPKGVMPTEQLGELCTFIQCDDDLRLLSNNAAKHGGGGGGNGGDTEVWTALSSGTFGKRHKTAQEFLEGTEVEEEVTRLLLEAVSRSVGLDANILTPKTIAASKLQLWGAAQPINAWVVEGEHGEGKGCCWDADNTIGIVGDWIVPSSDNSKDDGDAAWGLPSTMESAWLSGRALAEHLADASSVKTSCGLMLGKEGGCFDAVDGGGFGEGGGGKAWVSQPSEERKSGGSGGGSSRSASPPPRGKENNNDKLFVRNVPYRTTEEEMQTHFETVGKVVSVELLQGNDGRPRGLARVRMAKASDAVAVCEALDGKVLSGRQLRIGLDERKRS